MKIIPPKRQGKILISEFIMVFKKIKIKVGSSRLLLSSAVNTWTRVSNFLPLTCLGSPGHGGFCLS